MAGIQSSFQLNNLSLPNRLILPPLAIEKAGPKGDVTQEIIEHYDEKSHGGYLSMVIVEHSFITQQGKAGKRQLHKLVMPAALPVEPLQVWTQWPHQTLPQKMAKTAGFDGVEIHSAHGYLLNQFYSPLTNKRTDEYGGDIWGRTKIHREVIAAVREAAGGDFPLLVRLGACDY